MSSEQKEKPPQQQGEEKKELTPEEKERKKKEKKAAQEAKKREKEEAKKAAAEKRQREAEEAAAKELEAIKDNFGFSPIIRSQTYGAQKFTEVGALTEDIAGQQVVVRGRLQTQRVSGGKLAFIVLRSSIYTVQGVIAAAGDAVPKAAVKWVGKLYPESIVDVTGTVKKTAEPVASCTQSGVELEVTRMFVVSAAPPTLPFQLADASRREEKPTASDEGAEAGSQSTEDSSANKKEKVAITVAQDVRLTHRWLDVRTKANQALFLVNSRTCQFYREFLYGQGFIEIHTPKTIGVTSEGGAQVFKLEYHGRDAFLAQSPQLYKQMAINSDIRRVMEIGPVFRAEDSNTHRHLCEFTGMDWEMEIKEHYYEVLDLAERLFVHIFERLNETCGAALEAVREQYPFTDLVYKMTPEKIKELGVSVIDDDGADKQQNKDKYNGKVRNMEMRVLRLSFPDAVNIINDALPDVRKKVKKPEEWPDQEPLEDLSTPYEKLLGERVKERYGVEYFICDQYPYSARPFYTMRNANDPNYSNSYDMFIRGEEISSGAQRVHDAAMLLEQVKEKGVPPDGIKDYIDSFKLGSWPHGGMGVGLERVVMLFLGLDNIRKASLFPRDPKRLTP
eukprot:TRINITY_DN14111_c0_g1_i1.p1 TRINITY_DN14111_c0_g1~~TRINITY_DN14111_c0_g1_i1.p1  ORF type:complete len:618 (-),score=127.43 TRINITY_DN14111_c0_g1_i1:164-2017(-)